MPIVDYLLDDVGGSVVARRATARPGGHRRRDRTAPSYTIAMLAATRYRERAELIADDPGLLEVEVWRLFEVEGGGEDSLANHEKFFGDTWGNVFRDLAARDPAMRERLLDASLAALARDFSTYRAGWFSRFHESLAPTDDERAQRTDAYLRTSPKPRRPDGLVRGRGAAEDRRAPALPPDDLLDRIGPVLVEGPAGTAKAGLGLVGRAGAGSADARATGRHRGRGRRRSRNPSPDVQRAAIVLIGRAGRRTGRRRRAGGRRPPAGGRRIAAVGRGGAGRPAGRRAGSGSCGERVGPSTSSRPRRCHGRHLAPSPIDPARAIEPLTSLEALVDVAVSVLETGEPADDVERVLDAVGRLAADAAGGVRRLTAPLAKRARTILARRESHAVQRLRPAGRRRGASCSPGRRASSLNRARSTRRSTPEPVHSCPLARARSPRRPASGRPFVSVAAPTHAGGWIDPVVLVERLGARPTRSTLDLVAAILRLAPDGRDAALAGRPPASRGRSGAVVRYALGGDEPIGPTAAWWVAAARVRAPGAGRPGGREAPSTARTGCRVGPLGSGLAGCRPDAICHAAAARRSRPTAPADQRVDLPTVLMLQRSVVVLLDRALRPGDVPLDGDDPARLSRDLGRHRVAADRPERRLVVGRVGEPRLPRAVHRPGDGDRLRTRGAPRDRARARRRRASAASRPTWPGWRSPMAA